MLKNNKKIIEPEIKPEYLKKIEKISKEHGETFTSIEELRKKIGK